MGNVTEGMTKLVGEIGVMRDSRKTYVSSLKSYVSSLLSSFDSYHSAMAIRTKLSRRSFVKDLNKTVSEMRRINIDDLMGARAVWSGSFPSRVKSNHKSPLAKFGNVR